MKGRFNQLYVFFSDPRNVRLLWLTLALLALAVAGGAPDDASGGGYG